MRRVQQDTSLSRGNGCGPGTELVTRFKPFRRGPAEAGPSSCHGFVHTAMDLSTSARPHNDRAAVLHRQRQNLPIAKVANEVGASDVSGQHVGDVLADAHSTFGGGRVDVRPHRPRQAGHCDYPVTFVRLCHVPESAAAARI